MYFTSILAFTKISKRRAASIITIAAEIPLPPHMSLRRRLRSGQSTALFLNLIHRKNFTKGMLRACLPFILLKEINHFHPPSSCKSCLASQFPYHPLPSGPNRFIESDAFLRGRVIRDSVPPPLIIVGHLSSSVLDDTSAQRGTGVGSRSAEVSLRLLCTGV